MLGDQTRTSPQDLAGLHRDKDTQKARYFMVWRWHFYAGLYVIPFMLMLSLTGLVMLFDQEIEHIRYQEVLVITPAQQSVPVSQQLHQVEAAYPLAQVTQYLPATSPEIANKFSVKLASGQSVFVTVNPYTGEVLGQINRSHSWYQWANQIHGTLLLGSWGDHFIEISASLTILLLVSGLFLWLPRDKASRAGFLRVRFASGRRIMMRDLHANLGGCLSLVMLFFVISGLAWTGVWGSQLVQAWNTFPTYYTWGEKPESVVTHASLNTGSEEAIPWNLEQAAMPQSQAHVHGGAEQTSVTHPPYKANQQVGIDRIVGQAHQLGFDRYTLYLPQSESGVYTLAANSMAGQVTDPRLDRTTHLDQYTGEAVLEVTWQDYTRLAQLMAAGVSLHQGDLSLLNKIANTLFCLAFITISLLGLLMWWIRRPSGKTRMGIPPRFAQDGLWKVGVGTLLVIALCFPLAAAALVVFGAVDWWVFRHKE
ncbi:PepSY-associated TM helix domain-containing protein [Vibrio ostreicida]|uniref:PepSY-associated TM helix domain-containing protein n=1 Tax=Vibrio ostreicida TaxID=526588 RepID=UPI003B59F63F